ncbi:hypothetical protein TBR22_A26260 [Luteitalea sp. TBR-22]|uniref:outer membrane protein assembly factor BamB family protein n=1 Tax=Luteitalea sp. TBR-22 TaxID=2802971 RepID=UPI001AF6E289|nr:PQQ-binding-like beta-propeller repeat protein [Luteitalea sp. TBR-22]BCS33399.1 hypothetical protein TBR22_A26260 [Luteitalea sp. TBR-22]
MALALIAGAAAPAVAQAGGAPPPGPAAPAQATGPAAPTKAPATAAKAEGTSGAHALPLFPLRVRWSTELDGPPSATLATDGTRVFVPLATGGVIGVTAETGALVWKAEVSTTVAPAVADGHVYIVGGDALQALEAATGRAAWRVPLSSGISAPLVARSGWVIGALDTGEVVAWRGDDGTEVWRQKVGAPVVAAPAINGERLYLPGADGLVRALQIKTGAPIWTTSLGGSIVTIAPLGARVYVGSTDNFFYCLDDDKGRVRWRWRAGADPVGAAIADDDRVFFSSLDTMVRALDRGHGAQRWRQPLPWRPRTGPLRVGNTLVAAGIALDLRGYALDTGKPVGEFALTENRLEVLEGLPVVITRAALPGDYLVAAIADGRLVALEHAFGLPAKPLTDIPGEKIAITPPS